MARNLPFDVGRQLAVSLNQKAIQADKPVWHVLVHIAGNDRERRYGVCRVSIRSGDRLPSDPQALPPSSGNNLRSPARARASAREVNEEIRRLAVVPRRWCVVIRSLHLAPAAAEGGVR